MHSGNHHRHVHEIISLYRCTLITYFCLTCSLSNPYFFPQRILHSSISLDPPVTVGNDNSSSSNNSSSSSNSDTSTAAVAGAKVVDTLADNDSSGNNNNTTNSHGIIPTSMSSTEQDDDSTSTMVVHNSLPVSKEGDVVVAVGSSLNEVGSDLDRQDSMGAISWREHAIISDDG